MALFLDLFCFIDLFSIIAPKPHSLVNSDIMLSLEIKYVNTETLFPLYKIVLTITDLLHLYIVVYYIILWFYIHM